MFVHSGYFHIIFNILIQLVLGIPLEMVHRWWRILLVYFCGVIAGSLATSITDPNVYLAGIEPRGKKLLLAWSSGSDVVKHLLIKLKLIIKFWSMMQFLNWICYGGWEHLMNSNWAIVVLGSVVRCVYFNQQMGAVHWICFVENLFLITFLLFFPCFKFFCFIWKP